MAFPRVLLSLLLFAETMVPSIAAAVPLQSTTSHEGSFVSGPILLAFAAVSVLVVSGVLAGKSLQKNKNRRNPFKFLSSWWKRKQQGYIRQDDTQEESVITEVHSYYPPPAFSTSTSSEESMVQEEEESVSVMTKSIYYANSPILPPRQDEDSLVSERTYIPPTHDMIPPSRIISKTRTSRRGDSSFQSSLESVDSLVESYWDPSDDQSQLSLVPIEMNPSAVIQEHMAFLERQANFEERSKQKEVSRKSNRVYRH